MVGDIHARKLTIVGITQINLGESNDSVLDSDELQDTQMFFSLWLPPLVAINYQNARVDSTNSSQHIADESGMSWNINERNVVTTR